MVPLQLIMRIHCPEGCLMNVFVLYSHLMVTRPQVNIGKYHCSSHLIKEVINPRQRIFILYSDFVQLLIINTYPECTIFLFSQSEPVLPNETHSVRYTSFPTTLAVASSTLASPMYSLCRVTWTLVLILAQVQW